MAAKKKAEKQELDLFSNKPSKSRKPKKWKFPRGVKYASVKLGDILIFSQSRNWAHKGAIEEAQGVLIEKGKLDSKTQYFKVQMINPDDEITKDKDIRRYLITKK